MDLSPEQEQQYEEQLDDLSEKDILLEIMCELKAIRYHLANQTRPPDEPRSESEIETETAYTCRTCKKTIPESDRERHLIEQHNAPHGLSVEGEFEPL